MPETASRGKPARSARDTARTEPGLGPVRVSYYRRMKPQRVYPWVVTWPRGQNDRKSAGQELTVRLLIAGAQVLPAEQSLKAGGEATFFVTPIAKGWLKAQRLEVLMGGRKVQEIPLASHVVSQRRTWMLLFLAVFTPWFLWSYFHFSPFHYHHVIKDGFAYTQQVTNKGIIQPKKSSLIGADMGQFVKDVAGPPDFAKEYLSKDIIDLMEQDIPNYTGGFYGEVCQQIRDHKVGFYGGVLFFLLALFSAFFRRAKRKTVLGKPLPLPASGPAPDEDED